MQWLKWNLQGKIIKQREARRDDEKIEASDKHVESTIVKSISNDKIEYDIIVVKATESNEIVMTPRENGKTKIRFFESSLLYDVATL